VPSQVEELVEEADRQLSICNACRYCEGYCAVFPALELRTAFEAGDITYLANLCHDCRGCYQACMYTEPHPFAVDLPKLFTDLRTETYIDQAVPRSLGRAFLESRKTLAISALISAVIVLIALLASGGFASLTDEHTGPGAFYTVIASEAMIISGLALGLFGASVLLLGTARFWRSIGGTWREALSLRLWRTALREAATLRWLDGGGDDCYVPDPAAPSPWRRRFHHLVAYGFGFAFLATVSAAVAEHFLDQLPPYSFTSVPVISGLLGGVMMVAGCLGLLVVRNPPEPRQGALGITFLILLLLTAVTGCLLLALRDSAAMGSLLAIHLTCVFALFLTAPYGKFVHAFYRLAALLKSASEREREHELGA
jgi:citrate/tricarballylate utilization protein